MPDNEKIRKAQRRDMLRPYEGHAHLLSHAAYLTREAHDLFCRASLLDVSSSGKAHYLNGLGFRFLERADELEADADICRKVEDLAQEHGISNICITRNDLRFASNKGYFELVKALQMRAHIEPKYLSSAHSRKSRYSD